MAEITTKNGFEIYTIASTDGKTRASFVPEKGGVGCSIIMPFGDEEREILFLHDNFWDKKLADLPGGWPFLFPVCGRLERRGISGDYLYDGNIYNLPIHGFSWQMPWQVVDVDKPDTLVMELKENKDTLAMYPFCFTVRLKYTVCNGVLTCKQTYINTDKKPLVYYAGFHPYFLTPEPGTGKDAVMLDFKPVRLFRYNEQLTDLCGEKKMFDLPVSITAAHINEQLLQVEKDNVATLSFSDGFNLHLKSRGARDVNPFSYLQLYTMPAKPFFCAEPWMAFPNALNTSIGSRFLMPGKREEGCVELCALCDKKNVA
ncbi:MAG: aldose epimerase [Gammaproteobacteria bacterium]|nr:aldose epimerase [Gammaproteobacteria bacterium]